MDVKHRGAREALEHLVLGRNIVPELVELEYGIVQIRECKMGGDDIRAGVVGGMLNGGKVVNVVLTRQQQ